jgi:CBS domain containing-hemolysin-like protein
MHGLSLLKSVAVAMLILANAFFVAAEFALVSIRETRIEQLLDARVTGAGAVRRLQRGMDDLLPAVQLGVTLCSLALGWMGEPLVASIFAGWLSALPHASVYSQTAAHVAAISLGFALITYLHVVVGELVPKSLALRRAEALALAVAPPMLVFMAMVRPAVRLLRVSAAAVLRAFDVPLTERAQVHSAEELKLIATAARRMGLLPPFQETIVHRALELDEIPVREIMTPRQKIFSLPSNMPVDEAVARIVARHHSRVPVYDETRGPEHIVGVVYTRDLARLLFSRGTGASPVDLHLAQVMRDVLVVPETKSVLDLLRDFQQRRRHLAIAVDEYGSIVGLVTAEDAIEQLAGEFEDEFDAPAQPVLTTATGALLMDGGVNLRDLETQMQWDLPRDGGVETLAGFLLYRLGHIPREGESVVYDGRRLTVAEMDARRIAKIRVEPVDPAAAT